jgi:hypothetical protein
VLHARVLGGILESFGRMFKNDLKLYVYPLLEQKTGAVITSDNLRVAPNLRHLYACLCENRYVEGLKDIDEKCLPILSRTALLKLKSGDASWEGMSRLKSPRSSRNAPPGLQAGEIVETSAAQRSLCPQRIRGADRGKSYGNNCQR